LKAGAADVRVAARAAVYIVEERMVRCSVGVE
jgi:hypothetical protein